MNNSNNMNTNLLQNENQKLINGGFDKSNYDKNLCELSGVGFNRWEPLFFDPQKNSIEQFQRIGTNTVLSTLDESLKCSVSN